MVPKTHAEQKIQPKLDELKTLQDSIPTLNTSISYIDLMISDVNKKMADLKPKISVNESTSQHNHKQSIIAQKNRVLSDITSLQNEISPVAMSTEELKATMLRILEETRKHKEQSEVIENKILHLEYIRKGYSDRNKVKRMMMQDNIPFLNDRLRYYLDIMELDVKIQFTDTLGIESNYWGYDFQSNGEKRRTDVAMMFAAFDSHEHLYGRQCNILALDEVDGQMDSQGLNSLVHIIKNDLSNRVGSVLVISHKQTLQNVFGSEITVRKRGKFSYLE
jgi:DNA repair exonuclease SbcCD ATPase subunit